MELVDTHCHIQEAIEDGGIGPVPAIWHKAHPSAEVMVRSAAEAGVKQLICVGNALADSELAVQFAQNHKNVWASIGIHPHEAKDYVRSPQKLAQLAKLVSQPKVVAIGETGLDYHYLHSSKEDQKWLLRFHVKLALQHNLPLIFHIREAFEDFWGILDDFRAIRGVVHSFSTNNQILQEVLSRGLYIGLNGIMTFTDDQEQLAAAQAVPLDKLVLETDAPYLTPAPYRGTINEPKYVLRVARFLANLRGESLEELAIATTRNAQMLFGLKKDPV